MPTGELIGLISTVTLLAAAAGAVVSAVVVVRRDRAAEIRLRRVDVYAQWLASYLAATRASVSFVTAFRALAVVKRDSEYFSLRQDEAQRARTAWSDAMGELDHAVAALLVWSVDESIRSRLGRFERVSPETLRATIDGHRRNVARLIQRLRDADERAAEFVRTSTAGARPRRPSRGVLLTRAEAYIESIVDHWSRAR